MKTSEVSILKQECTKNVAQKYFFLEMSVFVGRESFKRKQTASVSVLYYYNFDPQLISTIRQKKFLNQRYFV